MKFDIRALKLRKHVCTNVHVFYYFRHKLYVHTHINTYAIPRVLVQTFKYFIFLSYDLFFSKVYFTQCR